MHVVCWSKYTRCRCEIDPQWSHMEQRIHMWFEHKVKEYPPNEPDEAWEVPKRDCWTNTSLLLLHRLRKEGCNSRSDQVGLPTTWKILPVNPVTMESLKSWGRPKSNRNSPKSLWLIKNSQKMKRRCWKTVNQQKPCHSRKVVIPVYLTNLSSQIRWERRNFPEGE